MPAGTTRNVTAQVTEEDTQGRGAGRSRRPHPPVPQPRHPQRPGRHRHRRPDHPRPPSRARSASPQNPDPSDSDKAGNSNAEGSEPPPTPASLLSPAFTVQTGWHDPEPRLRRGIRPRRETLAARWLAARLQAHPAAPARHSPDGSEADQTDEAARARTLRPPSRPPRGWPGAARLPASMPGPTRR